MTDRTIAQLGSQILSGLDEYGCAWTLTELAGWHGSPASTLSPVQKTRAPGAWLSPRQLAPRSLAPSGLVQAPSRGALRDALDRLNAAAALDGSVLTVTEDDDQTRSMTVYRQDATLHTPVTDTLASWSLALVAVDPRKYGEQIIVSTGLPATSGGLTWPATWPIAWNSSSVSGVASINNPGNIAAPITIRIDGPCTSPQIRHDGLGAELLFASNYDLPSGSYLLIDMERRTVLEGGTASRNQWITDRGWFGLEPGDNDLIFDAATYNATARMTVTTAPAYL